MYLQQVFKISQMNKIIFAFIAVFLYLLQISCTPSENVKLITGSWQGTEWLVNGQPSGRNVQQTAFSFDGKNKYSFDYGDTKESGTYKVENDMLFTTPQGQNEMMVKILKLTKDSLVFDMNRGGIPEMLTLVKK